MWDTQLTQKVDATKDMISCKMWKCQIVGMVGGEREEDLLFSQQQVSIWYFAKNIEYYLTAYKLCI